MSWKLENPRIEKSAITFKRDLTKRRTIGRRGNKEDERRKVTKIHNSSRKSEKCKGQKLEGKRERVGIVYFY